MVEFTPVDLRSWSRADLFRLYTEEWPTCLVSVNVTLDATETIRALQERKLKLTPTLYYLTTKALCRQENYRMGYQDGVLGVWSHLQPQYPLLNEDHNMTFHSVPWSENFFDYYRAFVEDEVHNGHCRAARCGEQPPNAYVISNVPFVSFDSCSISLKNPKYVLAPCVFFGRHREEREKRLLPLSFTFHHGVADGYHFQRFYEALQSLLSRPKGWLEV